VTMLIYFGLHKRQASDGFWGTDLFNWSL
jgi:hypothetical protein